MNQAASFLNRLLILVIVLGGLYLCRQQIADYFGLNLGAFSELAPIEKKMGLEDTQPAAAVLPSYGFIRTDRTQLYREPGRDPFAYAMRGQQVTIMPSREQTSSGYLLVHHNGMSGWISRGNIQFDDPQGQQQQQNEAKN